MPQLINSAGSSVSVDSRRECLVLLLILTLAAWIVVTAAFRERGFMNPAARFQFKSKHGMFFLMFFVCLDAGMDGVFVCLRNRDRRWTYFYGALIMMMYRAMATAVATAYITRDRLREYRAYLDVKAMNRGNIVYSSVLLAGITHSPWLWVLLPWHRTRLSKKLSGFATAGMLYAASGIVLVCTTSQLIIKSVFLVRVGPSSSLIDGVTLIMGIATNALVVIVTAVAAVTALIVLGRQHKLSMTDTEREGVPTLAVDELDGYDPDAWDALEAKNRVPTMKLNFKEDFAKLEAPPYEHQSPDTLAIGFEPPRKDDDDLSISFAAEEKDERLMHPQLKEEKDDLA